MKPFLSIAASVLALLLLPLLPAHAADIDKQMAGLSDKYAVATFAGGCFWCMEARFEKVPGVHKVFNGYTGGKEEEPGYDAVSTGKTGHVEAIRVYYNPAIISFEGLINVYWRITDPTDSKGQFVDRGAQYRPVIYYHNARQKRLATRARAKLRRSLRYNKPVTVPIEAASTFWLAEDYHQDFYKKKSVKFRNFRYSNPRLVFQKKIWGRDLKVDYSKFRPKSARESRIEGNKIIDRL